MLELPIKKQWFDMIRKGQKKVEYREIKDYWSQRFTRIGLLDAFYRDKKIIYKPCGGKVLVRFKNGYGNDCPQFTALVSLSVGKGKPEWGAEDGVDYYRLYIHKIEE